MRYRQLLTSFLALLLVSGCATLPPGPRVNVVPAQGKSFETFRSEDEACRQWSEQRTGASTQESYDKNVAPEQLQERL